MEVNELAKSLSKGDLTGKLPPPDNELASPLKSLHASLKHLTWQAQQIAQGDYQQRVSFMGDFAAAFNTMAVQLEERHILNIQEKSRLHQYIKLIISTTPNILLAFDTEGKAVLASKSYILRSKKGSIEEIQGKTFAEIIAPVSTEDFICEMNNSFEMATVDRRASVIEQSIDFGQDGNTRTYLVHISPMTSDDEIFMGTMVVFDDMTEIVQARHEAERAREFAEQSARVKSEFLARMGHEMRTPMNAIIGMASIGTASKDEERRSYCFNNINEASYQLLGVIDDIMDMSEIETDHIELLNREFIFENMINRVKETIGPKAEKNKQTLEFDIDSAISASITSDERRLAQVILNLLSNAVKFTPELGSIALIVKKIAATDNSSTIRFTIKDTGIGISEEQQKDLFKPFEQADGGRSRKYGGTGLGLPISKHIVELMGGNIWIESELDKGASFIFEINVQTGTGTHIDDDDAPTDGIFLGKRIMVAEDVEINREIIHALLEDTGIDIDFAINGIEAYEKFTAAPDAYELIFMDIQMPEMDGYEATKRIRSSGLSRSETIPIIAITANVLREDIELCLEAGMNGHLGKPVEVKEVIAKLKQYSC
jgi:signal transduction histidine kinase